MKRVIQGGSGGEGHTDQGEQLSSIAGMADAEGLIPGDGKKGFMPMVLQPHPMGDIM